MACTTWTEHLTGRLYGEIAPEDDAALTAHLASCAACREQLAQLTRVRERLREDEPVLPRVPRVVVLRDRSRVRPALMAASLLGAAILAGTGAGLGYAWGRAQTAPATAAVTPDPAASTVANEEAVRREVDRRFAAWEASQAGGGKTVPAASGAAAAGDPAVTASALRAEFAKFERRLNGARASDLDYMLEQIAASEYRVGSRIGKTNDALRTVALASNSVLAEQ